MNSGAIKYLVAVLLLFAAPASFGQHVRAVPDSVVQEMKGRKAFRYANDTAFWQKQTPKDESALARLMSALAGNLVLKWFLYLLLAAAVTYIIYQVIVVNQLFIFSRAEKRKTKEKTVQEALPDDLNERLEDAVSAKEYRLAVRLFYLKTLSSLHAGGKIKWHAEATNEEYVRQMRSHFNWAEFRRLTGIYEYVWYGEFQPGASQFEAISASFNQFNKRI